MRRVSVLTFSLRAYSTIQFFSLFEHHRKGRFLKEQSSTETANPGACVTGKFSKVWRLKIVSQTSSLDHEHSAPVEPFSVVCN